MESSRIPLKTWLLVTYMMTTARKGISSCQISREIGITQKTAWFMLQRIRESWATENNMFSGEIEIDEAYYIYNSQTYLSTDISHNPFIYLNYFSI
ncbi:hypothetical protein [Candidatus Liberibacter solanacearum]|nr:hypothetical protein [Candidatus Liberibacter solanacearum]